MKPGFHAEAVRKTQASEYLIRFGFGGAMTAMAGLVAHVYGAVIGGLFLAFPAILPASLTFVARHGGREKAAAQARGAVLGAIALVAFAGVVWSLGVKTLPAFSIAAAAVSWIGTACILWWVFYGRHVA
jgi:uncharacterized membrane protein (GlpM family)